MQVGGLGPGGRPGTLNEQGLQPRVALAGARRVALAGTLVAPRAEAGPGDQVTTRREAAHVGADLGDNALAGELAHPGNGLHQAYGLAKGLEARLHLLVDLVDRLVDGIDMAQMQAQQEAVMPGHPPPQGFAQHLRWCLDAPVRQRRQHRRIALALHQRLDHPPPAHAHDVADHRVELDVGVLQGLLQAQRMAGPLAHQLLARSQQAAQFLRRLVRHEARPDQAMGFQIAQPVAVADVALAPRHVLHVRCIRQHQLALAVVQDVPHRLPVNPGRLHHHVIDAVAVQPIRQRQQLTRRRLEAPHLLLDTTALGQTNTAHYRVLVNVQARTTLMKDFHRCLPKLCRRQGSPLREI